MKHTLDFVKASRLLTSYDMRVVNETAYKLKDYENEERAKEEIISNIYYLYNRLKSTNNEQEKENIRAGLRKWNILEALYKDFKD